MSLSPRPEMLTIRMSRGAERGREADAFGDGVRAFERGDDAFGARETERGVEGFGIGGGGVLGAAGIVQRRVLRADGGVVEAGGDGVREGDLAVVVLQNVGVGALQIRREIRR